MNSTCRHSYLYFFQRAASLHTPTLSRRLSRSAQLPPLPVLLPLPREALAHLSWWVVSRRAWSVLLVSSSRSYFLLYVPSYPTPHINQMFMIYLYSAGGVNAVKSSRSSMPRLSGANLPFLWMMSLPMAVPVPMAAPRVHRP